VLDDVRHLAHAMRQAEALVTVYVDQIGGQNFLQHAPQMREGRGAAIHGLQPADKSSTERDGIGSVEAEQLCRIGRCKMIDGLGKVVWHRITRWWWPAEAVMHLGRPGENRPGDA
jgi:hypothetical protein